MTVNELSMVDPMLHFRIAAGFNGLYRKVTNVAILEHESVRGRCEEFSRGDFIITTLFFARDDPSLIFQAIELLLDRGVSGLAIKTVYYQDLDQQLKDYADEKQFPIFFFDDVRLTDVLLYTYNVLNAQKEAAFYESKLRQLFPAPVEEAAVLQSICTINPAFQKHFYCACLTPATPAAALALQDSVVLFNRTLNLEKRYSSLIRYENSWLVLSSFPEAQIPEHLARHFCALIHQYQMDERSFICGLSRVHHELGQFDIALTEAFSANKLAARRNLPLLCHQEMGVYQVLLPELNSRSFLEFIRVTQAVLEEYDARYQSNLLQTLRVYVACDGRLAQTAERLFLHVNTVRYRLDKARELLQMDDFYVQAYLFVKTYEFLNPETP